MGRREVPRESPRSPKEGKCLTRLLSHLVEFSPSISRTIPVLATPFPTPWARVRDSSHSLLPAAHVVRLGPWGGCSLDPQTNPWVFLGPLPVIPPRSHVFAFSRPPPFLILQGVQERENNNSIPAIPNVPVLFDAPNSCWAVNPRAAREAVKALGRKGEKYPVEKQMPP